MNPAHNIYIHVPFCMSKCNYCAFFSHACANPDWDKYQDEIQNEIEHWGHVLGRVTIPTIFFGGGTPSLMPIKCFEKIIGKIHQCFNVQADAEITIESNPGTIDKIKMHDFKSNGMNRISIGIQSMDDERLKYLGRRHSVSDAIHTLITAQDMGLGVSGDFIYGLPGDTVTDIINTCKKINSLGLTHCSMYELTIEDGTPLARTNPVMPSNNEMAEMYLAIQNTLDLDRYEVSNYATPGNHCRHNENVWDGAPYIGIGRGAAGRIYYNNTWYEQRGNGAEFSPMTSDNRAIEKVITGMRTMRGTHLTDDVKRVINMDTILSMPEHIRISGNRIHATDAGIMVLDDMLAKIIR